MDELTDRFEAIAHALQDPDPKKREARLSQFRGDHDLQAAIYRRWSAKEFLNLALSRLNGPLPISIETLRLYRGSNA